MSNLTEKAVLVTLSISQWSGRKLDRELGREIELNHSVTKAGNFNKILVTSEQLGPVRQAADSLKEFHVNNTLPWDDKGSRILPTENFFHYVQNMGSFKSKFTHEVETFIRNYYSVLQEAEIRLASLFKASEYPSVGSLRNRFALKTVILPLPSADFRVSLQDNELELLRSNAQNELRERMAVAQGENWRRVGEHLNRLVAVLSSDKPIFRSSLIPATQELVRLIPMLNILSDPALTDLQARLSELSTDVKNLRLSAEARSTELVLVWGIQRDFAHYLEP